MLGWGMERWEMFGEHGWCQDQAENKRKIEQFVLFFATNVLSPLRESSFYLGHLKMDFLLSLSFLSCVPICSCELWIKLKSTCATHSTPRPSVFADDVLRAPAREDLWDRKGAWKGAAGLSLILGTLVSPHPVPGSSPISFSSPFREVSGPVKLGREVLRGLRNPLFFISEQVLLKPGFVTYVRENCPILREQGSISRCQKPPTVPLPRTVSCKGPAPQGLLPCLYPPFTYSLKGILAFLFLLCLH